MLAIMVAPALLADALSTNDIAVSPKVAGRLSGRSAAAIRRAVDAGDLAAHGRTHRSIPLRALAAWTGTPLAIERLRPPQAHRSTTNQTTGATVAGGQCGRRNPGAGR